MDCPGPRGFPQPMTNDGYRAQPFWSSLSRVQRIVKNVPAYAGCEPHEISWPDFRERWVPGLTTDNVRVGVKWSGARAVGYDLLPQEVLRNVVAANHYREESRQTRIGNRGLKTRVPSARRSCIPGSSAQLEFVFIRWGSAMDFPDDAD